MLRRSHLQQFLRSTTPFLTSGTASTVLSGGDHEVTLNGFGVMMNNPTKDIFVKKWTDDTLQRLTSQSFCPFVSSLEVGCAFGAASLNLMKQAASKQQQENTTAVATKSLYLTANDIEPKHLKKLLSRYENWNIEEAKKQNSKQDNNNTKNQLRTWPGRIPDIFEQQNRLLETPPHQQNQQEEVVTSLTKFDTILIANVLHFLTPEEIHQTLSFLYKNHSIKGTKIYISLDSPFTNAYKSFLPIYKIKKNILKSENPGFTSRRILKRRFVQKRIPERLKGMDCYHVMEPDTLMRFVKEAGWSLENDNDSGSSCFLFPGDDEGNPKGVTLNGKEMVGICAVKM